MTHTEPAVKQAADLLLEQKRQNDNGADPGELP
jgi:hypothetical protein